MSQKIDESEKKNKGERGLINDEVQKDEDVEWYVEKKYASENGEK